MSKCIQHQHLNMQSTEMDMKTKRIDKMSPKLTVMTTMSMSVVQLESLSFLDSFDSGPCPARTYYKLNRLQVIL